MAAPLPLRFYNPVKDLCKKVNLDYETVIGTGVSNPVIRDAFICAEVLKPITEIKAEDRKFIKHKKDFFNNKYGTNGGNTTTAASEGEERDTGRIRYDAGVTVDFIQPDDSKVDESNTVSSSVEVSNTSASQAIFTNRELFESIKPKQSWKPGRK